ncbi:MAG: peptidoglycan-binding protein LysM [Pseudomonadota bacterium]
MGLISFVKDAGKRLFGGGDNPAEAIEKEVAELGLEGDVTVEVDGDTVKIGGSAPTQELREKIVLAAGNVEGIAAVDDSIEAGDGGDEAEYHTVEKGDTLWAVATKAYGDGSKYTAIFEANKPMLSDPDKIYPGQVLRLPKLA